LSLLHGNTNSEIMSACKMNRVSASQLNI